LIQLSGRLSSWILGKQNRSLSAHGLLADTVSIQYKLSQQPPCHRGCTMEIQILTPNSWLIPL
jgi:hypothetical protein